MDQRLSFSKEGSQWFIWKHLKQHIGSPRSLFPWEDLYQSRVQNLSKTRSQLWLPAHLSIHSCWWNRTPLDPHRLPFSPDKHGQNWSIQPHKIGVYVHSFQFITSPHDYVKTNQSTAVTSSTLTSDAVTPGWAFPLKTISADTSDFTPPLILM